MLYEIPAVSSLCPEGYQLVLEEGDLLLDTHSDVRRCGSTLPLFGGGRGGPRNGGRGMRRRPRCIPGGDRRA